MMSKTRERETSKKEKKERDKKRKHERERKRVEETVPIFLSEVEGAQGLSIIADFVSTLC